MDQEQRETTFQLRQDEATTRALERMADAATQPRASHEFVWVQMWASVANSVNCQDAETAARWADKGLKQFRERFSSMPPNTN